MSIVPNRMFRTVSIVFLSLFVLIGIFIATIPTVLSSNIGKQTIINTVNSQIPGKFYVNHLSLSWFGQQKINGIELQEPSGQSVLSIQTVESSASFFSLLINGIQLHDTHIQDLKASISPDTTGETNLKRALGNNVPPQLSEVLSEFLGNSINVSFNQSAHEFFLKLTSPYVDLDFSTEIVDGILKLKKPLAASFQMTPNTLRQLVPQLDTNTPVNVKATVSQLNLPLEFFGQGLNSSQLNDFNFQMELAVPHADFIQNFLVTLDAAKSSQWLEIHGKGHVNYDNAPLSFNLDLLTAKPFNIENFVEVLVQPSELNLTFENIPTRQIDHWLGNLDLFEEILGDRSTVQLQSTANDAQSLALSLNSPKIEIPRIQIHVDQPLQLQHQFSRQSFSGKMEIEKVIFKEMNGDAEIKDFTIPWKISHGGAEIEVSIHSDLLEGNLFIKNRSSISDGKILTNLKGKHIPSPFLQAITGRREWAPLFGANININLHADLNHLNGPIRATISGSQGSLHLDSQLTHGVLTLKEPLKLETRATPMLGKEVLSQFSSAFLELKHAEGPIRLSISPDQFSLPVFPYKISQFHIGNGILELGKVHLKNSGDVAQILGVFRPVRSEDVSVWTTPLYFNVKSGVIGIYRMDMLLMDRYPMATWGKIDLVNEQLNMVVGITGTALARGLDMPELEKTSMVQLPIQGKINRAKIDTSKLSSRVASLVAQQSGGPQGLVLGAFLELANGKQGKVPAPTTSPLPWENELSSQQEQHRSTKKENHNEPINEIKKGASKLLKDLFK